MIVFFNILKRIVISVFCGLVWLFTFALVPAFLFPGNDVGLLIFVFGYLISSFLVFIYFSKRNKLNGDKSFNLVMAAFKADIKNLYTEIKKFFTVLFQGLIVVGVITIIVLGGAALWGWIFSGNLDGPIPSYDSSSYSSNVSKSCQEPENPYNYGSGHYAGFQWGENGNSCGGNSTSFIDGCEEYLRQEEAYISCISE